MFLDNNIELLPNTSPFTIKKLKSLNINTYFDLLNYFPFRYVNYSIISKIKDIQPGETVTIVGKIIEGKYQIARSGFRLQIFKVADESGEIEIGFYNQPYLLKLLKKGITVSFAGEIEKYGKKLVMKPKEYEIGQPEKHTGKIIPIYLEKKGLSSKTIREKIFYLLKNFESQEISEIIPEEIVRFNNLISEIDAYRLIHFPTSLETAKKAKERLAFDELFIIQLSSNLVKKDWEKEKVGNRFRIKNLELKIKNFIDKLPFRLTRAQERVWKEILIDLQKEKPMNRFLQGEVGSGKTVVAALACYLSFLNGYQSLFMAPTEILAQQHYKTFIELFKKSENLNPKIELITSSTKKTKNKADIYIGTHALISKKRNFSQVGLVIIDEQHRFGVNQRAELKNKGLNPHLLTMTATPIPRTVALTLYGELDISIIDEMPKGRLPIKTFFVPKNKRASGYQWIKSQIKNHHSQVFIVCPLIEESEVETMKSLKAAKKEYENLKKIFSQFRLNLLHGKMKADEKNKVMIDFKNHKFDILVSTPVVEVGVDIPNATIMLIEGADRFGLAQLHQLRGRVGRSNRQSYCFLFTESENLGILERLRLFAKTRDGNKLAEEDLKIRGPGDIYGVKQHGFIDLKIASLSDYQMIEKTKKAVLYFENHYKIKNFLELKERVEKYRKGKIARN